MRTCALIFFLLSFFSPDIIAQNASDLVINEFLASNVGAETDEVGQHEDWIELFNNSDIAINLTGIYLSDDAAKPDKWPFPLGAMILAKGFLVVWADEDQSQGPFHANFKLSAAGEFLMLSNGAGGVIDSLSFGPQNVDTTFGRYPNGTGPFIFMQRTFNAPNSPLSANEPWLDASLQIFPNPVSDILNIKSDQPLGLVQVSDTLGRQMLQIDKENEQTAVLTLKNLPNGFYFLKIGDRAAHLISVQK